MRWITVMGAALVLLAAVVEADAQGGNGPGVNPSNPSDLTYRSNPQDLTAPGGSNRQDLVRRPAGVTSAVTSEVASLVTSGVVSCADTGTMMNRLSSAATQKIGTKRFIGYILSA